MRLQFWDHALLLSAQHVNAERLIFFLRSAFSTALYSLLKLERSQLERLGHWQSPQRLSHHALDFGFAGQLCLPTWPYLWHILYIVHENSSGPLRIIFVQQCAAYIPKRLHLRPPSAQRWKSKSRSIRHSQFPNRSNISKKMFAKEDLHWPKQTSVRIKTHLQHPSTHQDFIKLQYHSTKKAQHAESSMFILCITMIYYAHHPT